MADLLDLGLLPDDDGGGPAAGQRAEGGDEGDDGWTVVQGGRRRQQRQAKLFRDLVCDDWLHGEPLHDWRVGRIRLAPPPGAVQQGAGKRWQAAGACKPPCRATTFVCDLPLQWCPRGWALGGAPQQPITTASRCSGWCWPNACMGACQDRLHMPASR